MRQRTFASQAEFQKYGRKSRRELFLDEMELVVPWSGLLALVRPHYAVAGNGRRPVGLEVMLRTYFTPGKDSCWIVTLPLSRRSGGRFVGAATFWRPSSAETRAYTAAVTAGSMEGVRRPIRKCATNGRLCPHVFRHRKSREC